MAEGETTEEQHRLIESLTREHLRDSDAETLLGLLRPAALLSHVEGPVTRSHLGGSPMLDAGVAWPRWNDVPLSFLLMLDLNELRDIDTDLELPSKGLLNFGSSLDRVGGSTW